jgi:predicted DsbA family dithiol-disulfide isomerase
MRSYVLFASLAILMPLAPAQDVVAVVDGRPVLRGDLEARTRDKLLKLKTEEYDLQLATLNQRIDDLLIMQEAARRHLSAEELIRAETDAKLMPVSDAEAQAVIDNSRDAYAKLPPDEALKSVRASIARRRSDKLRADFIARLRAGHSFKILLEQPRLWDPIAGGHSTGPDGAPVQIVEFSDFQCPFCSKLTMALDRIRKEYGAKVRLSYKQFPLPSHPQADAAAQASLCAAEQGKFWEMHDQLFAEQRLLSEEAFAELGRRAGLDITAFEGCFAARRGKEELAADKADATSVSINSTPTFFVNGRMFVGARSYEALRDIVESELRK